MAFSWFGSRFSLQRRCFLYYGRFWTFCRACGNCNMMKPYFTGDGVTIFSGGLPRRIAAIARWLYADLCDFSAVLGPTRLWGGGAIGTGELSRLSGLGDRHPMRRVLRVPSGGCPVLRPSIGNCLRMPDPCSVDAELGLSAPSCPSQKTRLRGRGRPTWVDEENTKGRERLL